MKKLKTTLEIICGILLMCTFSACTVYKTGAELNGKPAVIANTVALKHTETPLQKFSDIASGIRIVVINSAPAPNRTAFSPTVENFVKESIKRYMRQMGFQLDVNESTDFVMQVTVNRFETNNTSMDIIVYDQSHREVYSTAANAYKATYNYYNAPYAKALQNIDWEGIAYLVQRRKLPALEQSAQVQGYGNTALEHTIINWEVTSRPAGADLYWRVISSTPDVKNTNKNYKSTTPYESTESFDIRGLTYQNSGDVQIELTCEKPGYLPQRKVFNVRMCLDQKSINAHFTLVKDE